MSDGQARGHDGEHGAGTPTYFFFVDGKKFDWPSPTMTGAQIKAAVPGLNPSFQIIQEGHGSDPDRPVADGDTFQLQLQGRGPLHFYTAPPATFGMSNR
jgi:hypothetical protein